MTLTERPRRQRDATPALRRGERKRLVLLDEDDKQTALFFLRWLQAPTRIGAVAPSSRQLGLAMARQVAAGGTDPVIELGGGTGSVTRALLESGIAPERLVVLERDERLFRILQTRFPMVRVVKGDARVLRRLLAPLGITKAAAIVSCLPLISMPRLTCLRIVAESFALLGAGRPFIQFTYGLTSPLAREKLGLKGRITARIWANLPPASVWRYERPRLHQVA